MEADKISLSNNHQLKVKRDNNIDAITYVKLFQCQRSNFEDHWRGRKDLRNILRDRGQAGLSCFKKSCRFFLFFSFLVPYSPFKSSLALEDLIWTCFETVPGFWKSPTQNSSSRFFKHFALNCAYWAYYLGSATNYVLNIYVLLCGGGEGGAV